MINSNILESLHALGFEPTYTPIDDEPEKCVSLYIGQQKNGESRFLVTVSDFGDGLHWSMVRLDKWGGTGSRAACSSGNVLAFMYSQIAAIDRRDGKHRVTMSQSRAVES